MGKITKPIAFELTLEVPCSGEGVGASGGGLETTSGAAAKRKRDEDDHGDGAWGGQGGSDLSGQAPTDAKHAAYSYFAQAKKSEAEAKLGEGGGKRLKRLLRSMWNDLGPQAQSKYEKIALGSQSSGGGGSSSSGGDKSNPGMDHPKSSKKTCGPGNIGRIVQYDLTGVVVHHGGSIHSGHYVAFVKAPNGQWHEMNDSDVRLVNPQHVLKQQAYILFYTKRIPIPGTTCLDD